MPKQQTLGEKMRRGAIWLSASQVATRVLEFGFGIILARLLAPEDFGVLVTVQVFVGIASFFVAGGMAQALIRKKEIKEAEFNVVFTAQLLICSVFYAFFYHISPWFSWWFNQPIYEDLLRVSTLTFLARPFLAVSRARLLRDMRFGLNGLIQLSALTITGCSSIFLATQGFGVWSLVFSSLVGTLSVIVPLCFLSGWLPKICFNIEILNRLGSYGVKASGNDFMTYILGQIPNLIVGRMINSAAVGLFNKADSLNSIPFLLINGAIYQPVFRGLSELQDDLEKSKRLYLKSMVISVLYTLPCYIMLWWLGETFIVVAYGEKWLSVVEPLKILALGGLVRLVGNQSGALIAAQDLQGIELVVQMEAALLMIVFLFMGVSQGLIGIAIGVLIAQSFLNLRIIFIVTSFVNVRLIDILRVLRDPLAINFLLFIVMFVLDVGLNKFSYISVHSFIYMIIMGFSGLVVYVIGFLFIPLDSISSEAVRWRKMLRI
jgi:teichuronic acid exporter